MILESTLTCPHCHTPQLVTMPESSCQYQHTCNACQRLITAKAGECCVFCSYADYPCPPTQLAACACCGASE